jgi:DNA-binding NarL/FixJ family response regulator
MTPSMVSPIEPSPHKSGLWPPGNARAHVAADARPEVLLVCGEDADGEELRAMLGGNVGVFGPIGLNRCPALHAEHFGAAIVDIDAGEAAYDVVWQLSEAPIPCRSVVIGTHIDRATLREAFHIGVVACLKKPVERKMLELSVRRAVESTWVMRTCIRAFESEPAIEQPAVQLDLSHLTAREQEALALLLEGRSTEKMAELLGCSQRTVKFHVSNVLHKLGVGSRVSLLAKLR